MILIFNEIRNVMKENGVTGRELSKLIGINPPELSNILNGKVSVKFMTVQKIANALDISLINLIRRAERVNKKN